MSWLLQENWGWLLLSALLGAGITLWYVLRKVAVSQVRSRTETVGLPQVDVPEVDVPEVALGAGAGAVAGLGAALPEVDLPEVDLPELDLVSVDVPSVDAPSVDLPSVDLPSVDLPSVDLPEVDAPDVAAPSWDLPAADVPGVDVRGVDVPGVDVPSVDLPEVAMGAGAAVGLGAALPEADLPEVDVPEVDLPDAGVDVEAPAAWAAAAALPAVGAFGVGSADPLEGGASPHESFSIKGNADSMLYHTGESPYFGRTIAEVWFDSEDNARAAGFARWDEKKRAPVGFVALPAVGAFGVGSADPLEGGASPHESFSIKGNADSMLYHTDESPYFGRTIAEVWFDSEDNARSAGFARWDDPR